MSGNYAVGYRKPPERGQFKKGKSGNPKGRPKGTANFKTDLQNELEAGIKVMENGRRRTISKQRALLKQLMVDALSGDPKARQLLLNLTVAYERAGELMPTESPTPEGDRKILDRFFERMQRASAAQAKRGRT